MQSGAGELEMFVDNVSVGSGTRVHNATGNLNINRRLPLNDGISDHIYDEVAIFDTALTAQNISDVYDASINNAIDQSTLIAVYKNPADDLPTYPVSVDDDFTGADGDAPNPLLWSVSYSEHRGCDVSLNSNKIS